MINGINYILFHIKFQKEKLTAITSLGKVVTTCDYQKTDSGKLWLTALTKAVFLLELVHRKSNVTHTSNVPRTNFTKALWSDDENLCFKFDSNDPIKSWCCICHYSLAAVWVHWVIIGHVKTTYRYIVFNKIWIMSSQNICRMRSRSSNVCHIYYEKYNGKCVSAVSRLFRHSKKFVRNGIHS